MCIAMHNSFRVFRSKFSDFFPTFSKKNNFFSRLTFIEYSKLVTDKDHKPQLSFSHDALHMYSNHGAMQT